MAVGKAEKGRLRYLRATVTGLSRVQRTRLVAHRADRRPSRRAQPTRAAPSIPTSGASPHATGATAPCPDRPRASAARAPPNVSATTSHPRRGTTPLPTRPVPVAIGACRRPTPFGYRDADRLSPDKQRTSLPGAADDRTPGDPGRTSAPTIAGARRDTDAAPAGETARRRRCRSSDPAA